LVARILSLIETLVGVDNTKGPQAETQGVGSSALQEMMEGAAASGRVS
jgi:hypothetical protein